MKRLALVLAAAILGTGCIVAGDDTPADGSVNLYWDFIRTAPAQTSGVLVYDDSDVGVADGACNESGVELVTIDSPAGQVTVDCVYGGVEGVALDLLPAGTRTFRIRGWRGDLVVYDESFDLAVRGHATTDYFVDVHGVAAPLELFADLFNAQTNQLYADCAAARPVGSAFAPNLAFEIHDVLGNLVDDGVAGCVGGLPAPVFSGPLELDDYVIHLSALRAEDDALVFDSCPVSLAHFGAQTGLDGLERRLTTPVPIVCAL